MSESSEYLHEQKSKCRLSNNISHAPKCPRKRLIATKCARKSGGKGFAQRITMQTLYESELNTNNNFLIYPTEIISNEKGQTLQFKIPSNFTHFQCFAFTNFTYINRNYNYHHTRNKMQKK